MDKLTQINALEKGRGIQYLLDAAYVILRNPITMINTDYNLIAYAGRIAGDPLWDELISAGMFTLKTREFFAREFLSENAANANKKWFVKNKFIVYNRLLIYIYNIEYIKVAILALYECDAFDEDAVTAFEKLAEKITGEIRDDNNFTIYGRMYHEDKIVKLLDGAIDDPIFYTPQIQILYDGFEDYLYVAVVGAAGDEANNYDQAYFIDMLKDIYRSFKFAVYSGLVVIIMSSKFSKLDEKLIFYAQNDFFYQNNLYVGLSESFESLYELRDYFDKAVLALKNGIKTHNGRRIFTAGDSNNV